MASFGYGENMAGKKARAIAEFGDFQTPDALARKVLDVLKGIGLKPATVIEPTCGQGSFLAASAAAYPRAALLGLDINSEYVAAAQKRLAAHKKVRLIHGDFFCHDWLNELASLKGPSLVIGNPPWVTNAELGLLGSENLPTKSNFQNLKGLDALTGKSNFDISEWMVLQNLAWLSEKGGSLAVLCKMAVARKVLSFAWKRDVKIADARMYKIDALMYFGAAVDACLLVLQIDDTTRKTECSVYSDLDGSEPRGTFGFADNTVVSDLKAYRQYRGLRGNGGPLKWRSGVKHDCARVMELERVDGGWINGLDEIVQLENEYLFPLMKSSDIAGVRHRNREKYVIVPQRFVGEDTRQIKERAPGTWEYLNQHRAALIARTSVIYRGKPEFSIFGIGEYSFAPWKIAISGLYKRFAFKLYGPVGDKPVFFDDTVNFLSFRNQEEAENVFEMLNSEPARQFLESMVFWDDKRPITVDLLKRLDITKLAIDLGRPVIHRPYVSADRPGELPLAV
jgi:hypothetical protein